MLHKVRILVGALVHKPFTPRPEKVSPDGDLELPETGTADRDPSALAAREAEVPHTERVADLIAQRQQEETD